jgi:gliding motility-associated-like protein
LPVLATVTTNNSTISAGQTATLAATAPAGITIKWYSAPTGGVALAQGTSYTTAPLSATTTYYVETSNASGCVSATRVPVTVTVLGGPVNPNCNAANSQQSGIEGICVLCTIQNAGNSIDNNFTNFTTISLPVGVGGSGYQRLIFANSGVATDSIRLDLETPGGLADVTLLGGIKVTVMNGTSVVKTYNLQSSLLNLTLLSGKRFTATLPAGGVYDRVEIRAEGLANVLVNLNIYGATIVYPNPTVSAAGQTICSGSATVLSAAANGGTTLRWYSAATNGTLLHTGENFTTPVLNATTTYYIEVSKGSCANATRIPVTVKVTTAPGLPTVAAVAPICSGSAAVISVTAPVAGTDYNWYTTATGGTAIFTGSTFTTPVLTSGTTYYVEAANGTCVSATRVAVPVTVNPLPALPQISASATTVNVGQTAVLTGTSTDANVTFNWYTSANSTTPVYTGPTYVTPPLTITTTYFLEAKNASGCTASARAQVTITVNGGGPNPIACEAPTTQENGVDGVALLAGVFNPLLAIDNDAKTGSSLVMPVGLLGASVYQRVGFTTLSNVGDTVRVSISAPGKLLSVGLLSNIMIGTYNGNASNGDGVPLNDQLVRIELLSGNTEALVTFVPTKRFNKIEVRLNSGLAGVLSTVDFNYAQRVVVAPVVTAQNVTICANQTATLAVQTPLPGITYKWYNEAGAYQTGKDGATFTTPALSANTKFYVEAVTASGCTSYRTSVNVIVTPAPTTPVLVNATINSCVGNQVTIEVSNPLVGVTYKWYDGNGVYQSGKDGVTFTTTVGAAQTTYSVDATTSCGTSGKATATIKVGTLNPPVITPAAVTISSGSPAVLVATSSTAGAVFKWYSDATLATLVHTGAQYTTGALDNTTNAPIVKTFYVTVETTGAGACPASAAASVNVTILPKPIPGAIPCQAATVAIKDGVDGVAILSAVFNPGFAVDNNSESGSSFVMPVGALGASVYQQVGFTGGLSSVGDTLRLRISSPGKLLSLTVLSSIEVTTLNNGASNNDMLVISNPIVDVQILSSGSEAIITYVPQKQFDGVELRLRSGLASVLTTLDFNYAQRILVAPSVQSATATACTGTSANLFVKNPVTGLTYKWFMRNGQTITYLTGKDGVSLATDPTLAAGTYDFYVAAVNGAIDCLSAKTKITVTILAAPDAPVAATGNPATTCPNTSATLAVNPVASVTFNWYDAATGGNLLASNTNTYTTPATLAVGTHDFYVEAVNGNSCVNTTPRTKITLTINPSAVAADINVAGANAPFCAGTSAKLTATSTTVTNPVFTWYSDAALTDVVFTGAIFNTPLLTGTTTYYVSVTGSNKCANTAADAKMVTVTVNPPATAADLDVTGGSAPFCAGAKVELTATTTTVTSPIFNWYSDAALTKLVFTGPKFVIPSLAATTTYYVTVSGSNKCENLASNAEIVTLTVNPPAIASDINVTGNQAPFCAGAKATLSATSATVLSPVFTWYSDAALTDVVFTGATFITPVLTATKTYYVTVRGSNKCENTAATAKTVTVTVNPPATAADINVAGADAPYCAGTKAKLVATTTTVTAPIFNWYSDAALTKLVFTGATFETPALSITTTYYVTVAGSNRCENTAATARTVTVTVNPPALATDINVAGADAPFCSGNKARLVATSTTVTNPVFTWYSDAALTTAVFTGPVFNTPALTATTTYYVTVRGSNKCENGTGDAKIITLTVNPPATAADIIVKGADSPFCAGTTATLDASSTTVTNPVFTWYTDAALTNAVFTGAKFVTPVLTATTKYYVTVRGSNKCENLAADAKVVTITVNPPATAADLNVTGNSAPLCAGATATLTATSTTVISPKFTWYSDAALTTVAFSGPIFKTPVLTATTTYYVTVSGSNKCETLAADAKVVTVTVNPPAIASDINVAGNDAPFCAGTKATLKATTTTTVTNPVFTWYSDAALTTVAFTGDTFVTPVLTATKTYYVTVRGDNKCENTAATAKTVTVVVNPPATAADINVDGAADPLCSGTAAKLTATSTTVTNPVFTWYSDAALTTVVFTGPVFDTPVLTATTTYYVTVRGSNKCENATGDAKIITLKVNPPATAADIIVKGADSPLCAGTTATLDASSTTVTNPVFTWYSDAALTNAVFTGAKFVTPVLTATTTYYVTVRGDNRCENLAASAKVVTVTINPPATAADLSVTGNSAPLCAGATATLTATSTTVTNPKFTWYSDAALTDVVFTGSIFKTPVLTATTTYYVTVRGDNRCETLAADAKVVTVTVNPPATAADINVAGNDAPFCAGTKATLVASSTTITNPVFTWYSDAALTTVAFTGDTFVTPVLTATTTYYVTVRGDNKCENTAATAKTVTVVVNPPSTAADINVDGAADPLCSGTAAKLTATSTTVTNPTFTWYSDAALTNAVFTGSVFNTPLLTATTNYYVTVRGDNRCDNLAASAKVVTVVVNPPASAADITVSGAGAPICAGTSAALTASTTTVTNPVFTWYSDAALTNVVSTGPAFTTPILTATTNYYVTVRGDNKCENLAASAKVVTITVNPLPNTPEVASAGTNICSGESTVLNVSNAEAGILYQWYSDATGGTLLFTGEQFTTPTLTTNTDYYVLAVSAAGCGNATGRVKVTVTVSPKPLTPVVVSAVVDACVGSSATLSVSNPQTNGVTYKWYTTATGGTAVGTGTTFTTPAITGMATYYVEASTASCVSTGRTAVKVNASPIPTAPTAIGGVDGPLCSGTTATLSVTNPDAALTYSWFTVATGGTSIAQGVTFTTPALTTTTTYYVESSNATGCKSTTRTSVVVTVLSKLDAPVVTVKENKATEITFQWNPIPGATAYEVSLDNGVTWVSPTAGPTGTTHLVAGLKPDQSVTIRVRAKGQLDCQLSDATSLTAKSDNPLGNTIFVPNTFTPNNDGKNDVLYVYGNTIAKMKLRVYNQWGQFIYESLNIQNGWDGTYKGDVQPNGVYVYFLEAEFNDGTKTTKKGTITLLR